MTGCRAGYVAIAGAICLFLIFNKNYKLCVLIALGCLGIAGFFVLNPDKFSTTRTRTIYLYDDFR